jgi:hypothetical protein
MEGRTHVQDRRVAIIALAACLMLALPPGSRAAAPEAVPLPSCATAPLLSGEVQVVTPWQTVLDGEGAVMEHRMTLRRQGLEVTLRTGRRGFAIPAPGGRLLVGERAAAGTSLTMVDTARGCRLWDRLLDDLAYDAGSAEDPGRVLLSLHDPLTRFFEGQALLDTESGDTVAMIDGQCSSACEPNDGDVAPADFAPAGPARPVPAFPAGGWPRDTSLPFTWAAGAVPPEWARAPITAGAADASETSAARSPRFVYRSSATDTVRYTPSFPTFCRYGIACASRNMPVYWSVWLRPHGTDYSWGTLRWCQKEDASGCFDIRRVMIHELGHVAGLDHPSSEGFGLAADETVMHAITPARPAAGSSRHAFGRCDVATLQELYDVPSYGTRISSCNDVATHLGLSAGSTSVAMGGSVRLRAVLRIASLESLGRLAGNVLDGRAVKLKMRRAGSDDAWTTLWMEPQQIDGTYDLTIAPQASWEFQAAFPAPENEGLRFSASDTLRVRVTK